MKNNVLISFYKAFVNLYGAIDTDDAYPILRNYISGLKKKDLMANLKNYYDGYHPKFQVIKTTKNTFIIADPKLTYDDLDSLFRKQMDKPYYDPHDLEKFLQFANNPFDIFVKENEDMVSKIKANCFKANLDDKSIDKVLKIIFNNIYQENKFDQKVVDKLARLGIKFETEADFRAFVDVYYRLHNNTRIRTNRGYTPHELGKLVMDKPNPNVSVDLGESFIKMVQDKDFDPDHFISHVNNLNIPELVKKQIIQKMEELLESKRHLA